MADEPPEKKRRVATAAAAAGATKRGPVYEGLVQLLSYQLLLPELTPLVLEYLGAFIEGLLSSRIPTDLHSYVPESLAVLDRSHLTLISRSKLARYLEVLSDENAALVNILYSAQKSPQLISCMDQGRLYCYSQAKLYEVMWDSHTKRCNYELVKELDTNVSQIAIDASGHYLYGYAHDMDHLILWDLDQPQEPSGGSLPIPEFCASLPQHDRALQPVRMVWAEDRLFLMNLETCDGLFIYDCQTRLFLGRREVNGMCASDMTIVGGELYLLDKNGQIAVYSLEEGGDGSWHRRWTVCEKEVVIGNSVMAWDSDRHQLWVAVHGSNEVKCFV